MINKSESDLEREVTRLAERIQKGDRTDDELFFDLAKRAMERFPQNSNFPTNIGDVLHFIVNHDYSEKEHQEIEDYDELKGLVQKGINFLEKSNSMVEAAETHAQLGNLYSILYNKKFKELFGKRVFRLNPLPYISEYWAGFKKDKCLTLGLSALAILSSPIWMPILAYVNTKEDISLLLNRSKFRKTEDHFKRAIELFNEPKSHIEYGNFFIRSDNYKRAEEIFRNAQTLFPESAEIALTLAEIYDALKKPEEAFQKRFKAAKLKYHDADFLVENVGDILYYISPKAMKKGIIDKEELKKLIPINIILNMNNEENRKNPEFLYKISKFKKERLDKKRRQDRRDGFYEYLLTRTIELNPQHKEARIDLIKYYSDNHEYFGDRKANIAYLIMNYMKHFSRAELLQAGIETDSEDMEKIIEMGLKVKNTKFEEMKQKTQNPNVKNETYLIKIGGSICDLHEKQPEVIESLIEAAVKLHKKYQVILVPGGGPAMDLAKSYKKGKLATDKNYSSMAKSLLEIQAKMIRGVIKKLGHSAEYLPPERLSEVTDQYLQNKILIATHAPENFGLPEKDSDTHTIAIANYFGKGVKKLIFAKNTDGVYLFDPLSTTRDQKDNHFFRGILAEEVLNGDVPSVGSMTRVCDKQEDEHLIENSALNYFIEKSNITQIHVVDGKQPDHLVAALQDSCPIPQHGSIIYKNRFEVPLEMFAEMFKRNSQTRP